MAGLFNRLFGRPKPPTQAQLDYAELCGVPVKPGMSAKSLSRAIDAAFKADPKLSFKIKARRKQRKAAANKLIDQLPTETKRQLKKWESAAEESDHFLVVYKSGKSCVVDILECDEVVFDGASMTFSIKFLAPKIINVLVGSDGNRKFYEDELRWQEGRLLSPEMVVEAKKVTISEDQVKRYRSIVQKKIVELKR